MFGVLTQEGNQRTAGWVNQCSGRIQIQHRSGRPTVSLSRHTQKSTHEQHVHFLVSIIHIMLLEPAFLIIILKSP